MNLGQTLTQSAARHPQADAVRLADQHVSFAELDRQVDAAAHTLQQSGVEPGDRVALIMGNRISFVVAIYAIWRIGAVAVPVNTSLTSAELAHVATDCTATVVVVGRAYVDTLAELRGSLPDVSQVFVADSTETVAVESGMQSWKQAVAGGGTPTPVNVDESTLAILSYTSGTTGNPKGAMLTHGQLLANQRQMGSSGIGVTATDVVMTALPLFHIYALNVALGMTIARGGVLELLERFEPMSALQVIANRRVTVIVGAPPMYVAWVNTPGAEDVDTSTVRLATSGAAPLPERIRERCWQDLGLDVREGYGLTEAAPVVTSSATLPQAVPGSVGTPLDGIQIKVMDEENEAETGDPGRILIRGDNVFSGYWEHPDATAEVLHDGWLETGDIGYVDDGLLYLVDRVKDLIIVSGFNVYPIEVERALATHPAVIQAGVVGVPHPYTGEAVKAFVVLEPGAEVTADELINHSATMLARFKQPQSVQFVGELPLLPTGKVRRRLLRHPSA